MLVAVAMALIGMRAMPQLGRSQRNGSPPSFSKGKVCSILAIPRERNAQELLQELQGKKAANQTVGLWRDTMLVPDSWTAKNCQDYMKDATGNSGLFQIGCFSANGLMLGEANSDAAAAPCWQ